MVDTKSRPPNYWKHFFGMIVIGILNNVPYWVAISSAQAICTHFERNGYIGAVTWGCVLFGFFATGGNAFLSSKNVSYVKRAVGNGVLMLIGLIGTAFSPSIFLAILCISMIGASSDFGEGVMLGYFAAIDDNSLLKAWGVGTGISGLIGAVYSFLCQYYKIQYFYSFLCLSWFGIAYPLAFYFMLDPNPKNNENIETTHDLDDIEQPLNVIPDTEKDVKPAGSIVDVIADKQGNPLILPEPEDNINRINADETESLSSHQQIHHSQDHAEKVGKTNENENLERVKSVDDIESLERGQEEIEKVSFCSARLWCRAIPFIVNNTLAFVFQYCCLEGLCDCSMTQEQRINQPYIFCLLSICYQIGQLISKSFARYFMTNKLWIFTILNGCVFTYMMINTPLRFSPIWLLDILMFCLGFFGGLSYMNIFDVMMKLDNTTAKEREIMTNYTSVTISGAIQIASGIILIFQNTFYRQYCKHT